MLQPPEGGERQPYFRPSTLGKDLDNKSAIIPWTQTNVMIGLARNKALWTRLRALVAKGATWDQAKGDFKDIIAKAESYGGSTDAADRGTAIHDYCEAAESGWLDWSLVDEGQKPIIEAWIEQVLPHVEIIATECFVAADIPVDLPRQETYTLRAAGSVDRIAVVDGKRRILDIKSGKDDVFRLGVTGQTYLYSRGALYRDEGVRQEVSWAEWNSSPDGLSERADTGVDQDVAIMALAPRSPNGKGVWEWKLLEVDLMRGRDVIDCGIWSRQVKKIPEFRRVL